MTRRPLAVFASLAALSCALGACGVSAQSQPKAIDQADVPFGLTQADHTAPTTSPESGAYSYTLYFVTQDRLRPVTRAAQNIPNPTSMLKALVRGPTPTETDAGLRTLLAPDLVVHDLTVDDGVATVALDGPGASRTARDEQALGIAQIVYTITGFSGVERVRFEVDERRAEIPRGDGSLSSQPVSRDDYPSVAP